MSDGEFGIVANVLDPDKALRLGAKVLLVDGTGGEGWDRFVVRGLCKSGRRIEKWCPTKRLHNFRAAWVPPKGGIRYHILTGSRAEMEAMAEQMTVMAEEQRAKRLERSPGPPCH